MKNIPSRRPCLPFVWPEPPLQIALVEPEIPPNTGNIARLCAATGTPLHIIGRPGFHLHDAALRRAGLDYWPAVKLQRHVHWDLFQLSIKPQRCFFFSTRAAQSYLENSYQPGDVLVFGNESRGLPEPLLASHPQAVLAIPMQVDKVRSLNLASAVSIVLFEALRQCQRPA